VTLDRQAGLRVALAALGAALAALATAPAPALATYPGRDGRIAYTANPTGAQPAYLFTVKPDGSGTRQLTDTPTEEPSWAPNGRHLVFMQRLPEGGSQIVTIRADGGQSRVITTFGSEVSVGSPSFAPNGREILYNTREEIRRVRTDGTNDRLVLGVYDGSALSSPQFAPDGKRIIFDGHPTSTGGYGIWTARPNGSGLKQLTADIEHEAPDYRPDGRRVLFFQYDSSYVMRANGQDQEKLPGYIQYGSWAPSGDRIVGAVTHPHPGDPSFSDCSDIYTASPAGKNLSRVTDYCTPNPQTPGGGFARDAAWQPLPKG
jgi:Tol biopolymer transport system component